MAAPAHPAVSGAPPRIQRFTGQATGQADIAPTSVDRVLASPGRRLEPSLRQDMEQRFGYDFSRVRVHSGAAAEQSARDVNANAYTVGHNIVFGAGRFVPGTQHGQRLLAHELAHVVQQDGAPGRTIQRTPDEHAAVDTPPVPDKDDEATQVGAQAGGGRVTRVIIATTDGTLTLETASTVYLYELDHWKIDQGSYIATLSQDKKGLKFDFGKDFADFYFTYTISKGQDNPATLLKGQKTVGIDVVATYEIDPQAKPIQCLLPMEDKEIIAESTSKTDLFPPYSKDSSWHIGSVPLGYLGWIDIDAHAGLSLAGLLSYGYGPGVLSDICLYRRVGGGVLGGAARFTFGAALSPSVNLKGKLKVAASYVSVVDLVSAEATLDASAIGRASGKLDGRVDLSYDTKKDKWKFDLAAQLSGAASLKLKATASAAITLLWKEVWSKQWKLDGDFGIAWTGGVRVGTDIKPRFDFGSVGILSDTDKQADPGGPSLEAASAAEPLSPKSEVDDNKILEASINRETGDPEHTPEGETPDDALPIVWYKPLNIYPKTMEIPRAIRPLTLDRDDGPTLVEFGASRRRTGSEMIGVGNDDKTGQTNWPLPVRRQDSPGKRFQFVEKTVGDTVKNRLRDAFNEQLLEPGHTLAGDDFDMDHVQEKQFGGQDAEPNLWPAKSAENRRAGKLHNDQKRVYRERLGSLAGRWFEIVAVRDP